MGRRVRFYLRTWLEVKTEENQSGICLTGTVQRPFLLNSCPLVKNKKLPTRNIRVFLLGPITEVKIQKTKNPYHTIWLFYGIIMPEI